MLRLPLEVSKALVNGRLKGGEFSFELRDGSGKVIALAQNAADGTVSFPDRTFSYEVSNYLYTIREVPGTDSDMLYDGTVYTVKVSTRAVNGRLEAKVDVEKDGTPYAGAIRFTNQKKMPQTGDDIYRKTAILLGLSALMAAGALTLGKKHKKLKG